MRKHPSARRVTGWARWSGALKGLNSGVVGGAALAGKLAEADALLAAELGITGQALTELAARADEIGTLFGGVDQALAQRARAAP